MKPAWYCRAIPRLANWRCCARSIKKPLQHAEAAGFGESKFECILQNHWVRKIAGRELDALTAVGSVLFNLDAALAR